jgi:hypothetical protein
VFSVSILRSLERDVFERLDRDVVLSPDETSVNRYLELPDNSPSHGAASISRNVIHRTRGTNRRMCTYCRSRSKVASMR